MRHILTLCTLFLSFTLIAQKDCSIQPSAFVPLTDLAGKTYRGYNGGLYANGSNERPNTHHHEILQQIAKIKPLNAQGQADTKGKIVMIGVGASNPRTEFESFKKKALDLKQLNPQLAFINTCIGGQGVQKMNDPGDNYWQSASNTLKNSGLSDKQVQLAWVETDNTQTGDTLFPRAPLQLMEDYRLLLEVLHDKYPNLQVVYFSARAFSGFATPVPGGVGKGLLFPRDYLSGWAVKWLIENAALQKPGFVTEGSNANIPHVTWGSYHWSNGNLPRGDGFVLDCQTDVGEDGLHLTAKGEDKIGQLMLDYFLNDPVSQLWLLKSTITGNESPDLSNLGINVFPNPFSTTLYLDAMLTMPEATLSLYNLQGMRVWQKKTDILGEKVYVDFDHLPTGMYLLECRWAAKRQVIKVVKKA